MNEEENLFCATSGLSGANDLHLQNVRRFGLNSLLEWPLRANELELSKRRRLGNVV